MTAAELVELLDHAKKTRTGWQARCPAHDDHVASLSIAESRDGRVLVKCHAGCEIDEILAALRLALRDLFVASKEDFPTRENAAYDYHDATGSLVFQVVRRGGKDFRQRRPNGSGWIWNLHDVERVLYRLPRVLAGVKSGGRVWVVEGEKDVHTLERLGLTATCNPMGANKWNRRQYTEALRGARVVVVPDCDVPGRESAEEIAEKLTGVAKDVRVFDLDVDRNDGYDVSDLVAEAGRDEARELLERAAEAAETRPTAQDSHEATTRASALISFEEIVARPVRWAWQGRIALGKITALAGRPKIGKGLLYSNLIAQVTRGECEGDLTGARDVIVVTTEDDPGDTLKPRLMVAGADLSRVSIFQMGAKDDPVPFRVPQDATELSHRVKEKDAALVVIDPLLEFVDGKLDAHKSQPVRQALAAVNQLARENGCAILTIFHLNKGISTDPLQRHEASAAFTQVVRGGMLLGHDPDDPDGEDGRQRVLAVSSSNLAAIAPALVYEIATARVMGDTGEEIVTARMACIGESSVGAHDLLRGRPDEEEQTGTDEAEAFLMAELANGPRSADEMIKAARRLGISDKQLRRARSRLRIDSEKAGFREGWEWSLPKAPSTKAPSPPSNRGAPWAPSASRAQNHPLEDTKAPHPETGHLRASSGNRSLQERCATEWERLQAMSAEPDGAHTRGAPSVTVDDLRAEAGLPPYQPSKSERQSRSESS